MRADLLCHDGCSGHMILSAACTLLLSVSGQARRQECRLFPVDLPWQLVINPGYAIRAATVEEEEGEEDECGVSWEAPSQTSAAITLITLPLPPSLLHHHTVYLPFLPFCLRDGSLWRAAAFH